MRKIKYPKNWRHEYWNIFSDNNKNELQKNWQKLKHKYSELSIFPKKVRKIICADFPKITTWYFKFIEKSISDELMKALKLLFCYSNYRDIIAKFFYSRIEQMNIFSCFYCDIHPIGKYEIENNSNNKENLTYRTFDVDHFYENAQIPILALSIKNFVPSCQVCNSRVKGKRDFLEFYGLNSKKMSQEEKKNILYKIAPMSKNCDFDANVHIYVLPKKGFTKKIKFLDNIDSYKIHISGDIDYINHVKAFRLNERYNSVTILAEALSILDLKRKFPISKIQEIKRLLSKGQKLITAEQIEEVIFRKNYDINRHSNLLKLKQDLLE